VWRLKGVAAFADIPPHVSGEFARGDFKTSKLQLAAAMPPPARKHTIFRDNIHVVLEVLFDPGMFGLKGPRNPCRVLLCPLGLALGV
jgi:hypothetical protein